MPTEPGSKDQESQNHALLWANLVLSVLPLKRTLNLKRKNWHWSLIWPQGYKFDQFLGFFQTHQFGLLLDSHKLCFYGHSRDAFLSRNILLRRPNLSTTFLSKFAANVGGLLSHVYHTTSICDFTMPLLFKGCSPISLTHISTWWMLGPERLGDTTNCWFNLSCFIFLLLFRQIGSVDFFSKWDISLVGK